MPFGEILAAAIPSAIGLFSGNSQSSAISQGNAAAQAAAQQAIATGAKNYTSDRANFAPYLSTGQNALTQYANLEGLNGQAAATNALSSFQASPGYQYQVQQGLMGVDQGAAAQGILNSGSTLKAEQTLGSNLANQDYSAYLGRLGNLATGGLTAAQGDNTTTQNYNSLLNSQTNSIAGTAASAAGAQASIYGNTGNQLQNAAYTNGLGTGLNSLFGSGSASGYNGTGQLNTGQAAYYNNLQSQYPTTGSGTAIPGSV